MSGLMQGDALERADGWLVARRLRVVLALLGAAAFVRLIFCLQVAAGPLPRVHEIVRDSDDRFFDEWGRYLAAGNWLQRQPLHPMTSWMERVAGEALKADPAIVQRLAIPPGEAAAQRRALWDHWLGGRTYYQEPGYAYLVGLTYRLTGADLWHVFIWQLVMGALSVLLVHAVARRLFGDTAALGAGALFVLAPIPLMFETTLLRDCLVAFATLATTLLMIWAPEGGRRRWLLLGLAFGVAVLIKQSFLAFPPLFGLWRLAMVKSTHRARLVAAASVLGGMALGLAPALMRNLIVGAPMLALNGSASAMIAIFHTADASPINLVIPPTYTRLLMESDGRFLASLLGALKTHSSFFGLVSLNLHKLLYVFHGYEQPNNVDYYLFRQASSMIWLLPVTFVVLLPLSCVGVLKNPKAAGPIFVAVLGSLPTMILAVGLSRYRSAMVAAMFPLAGAGLALLIGWALRRRWLLLGLAAVATSLYLAWAVGEPRGQSRDARALHYALVGRGSLAAGESGYASLVLRESLRLSPHPEAELLLGQALLAGGEAEEALPHLAAAARAFDSAQVRALYQRALEASGHRQAGAPDPDGG